MGPCIAFIKIVIVFFNTFWKVVETLCGTCLTHKNSWAEGHKSRNQSGKVDSCADCYFWINHWICDPFLSKEEGNGEKLPLMFFCMGCMANFFIFHYYIWIFEFGTWPDTQHLHSEHRNQGSFQTSSDKIWLFLGQNWWKPAFGGRFFFDCQRDSFLK